MLSPSAVPPPPRWATSTTPASDRRFPPHARAGTRGPPVVAARIATSTGTAPITTAASLTVVRSIPAFWRTITPPNPTAPVASTAGLSAWRSSRRAMKPSTGAATMNRAAVSHAGLSQPSASLDSGTVRPHRTPAAINATTAFCRKRFIQTRIAHSPRIFALDSTSRQMRD